MSGYWVFDVDGCLIDSLTGTSLRPGAVELLQGLRAAGHVVLLWSAGGADYAERRATEHGIAALCGGFHGKDERDGDGRYRPDAFLAGLEGAVFVDDRPEDMPIGAHVITVSPYLAPNRHDRALTTLLAVTSPRPDASYVVGHREDRAMVNDDRLTSQFEESRPRLQAVAYRMLGSRAEAEDAVQESWLRLELADHESIDNFGGWLTTVTARVCLDRLRRRQARREDFVTANEGVDPPAAAAGSDPADEVLVAESIGAALLVVLDALAPAERVAFVLHDVFAVPFDEISPIVGRSTDATRQLASRARRRVQGTNATADVDLVRHRDIVNAFLLAARHGDFERLMQLLDPEVVLQPDPSAVGMGTLRETHGASAVAGVLSGGARGTHLAVVDGVTALVWAPRGDIRGVIEFVIVGDKITELNVIGDAERIRDLEIVPVDS